MKGILWRLNEYCRKIEKGYSLKCKKLIWIMYSEKWYENGMF